jgi:site-specific DNA recombinase
VLVHGRPSYRCRRGHSSAVVPDLGRPGNLYIHEDRILPHLLAMYLLLTGTGPAAGRRRRRTRHGADVNRPASDDDVISYLRARQVTLTHHPATRTLQADNPGGAEAVIGLLS